MADHRHRKQALGTCSWWQPGTQCPPRACGREEDGSPCSQPHSVPPGGFLRTTRQRGWQRCKYPIFCGDPNSRKPAGSARAPCPHVLRCGSCWQQTGTGITGSGSATRSPQLTTVLGPAHRGALPEAPLGISGLQKLLMEADQGRTVEQRPSRPQAVAASRAWGPMAA